MISSNGTPSVSAAICPKTVSDPVPRSVAPTKRLKEPSSLILMLAPPISRLGIDVPCISKATPIPFFRWSLPGTACQLGLPYFSSQPIACRPCWTHSTRPLVTMVSGLGSRPSLQAVLKGCSSPGRSAFFNRNSKGSKSSALTIVSKCRSIAQKPCGTP